MAQPGELQPNGRVEEDIAHGYVPLRNALRWCRCGLGVVILAELVLFIVSSAYDSDTRSLSSIEALGSRRLAQVVEGNSSTLNCAHHYEHNLNGTVSFLLFCFLICCLCEWLNLTIPHHVRFPISVLMFVAGKIIGYLILKVVSRDQLFRRKGFEDLIDGLEGAAWFDPHALLYIVLPPLLYESASSMSWRVLRKVLPSAVLLAVPGVILNTFITGIFVKGFVRVRDDAPSLPTSLLLASILSATDPVAVVASLSALGAPAKLSALVEGESLLNDGSAVVATYVFRDWVLGENGHTAGQYCPGSPPEVACILRYFCQVAIGGAAIGFGAGLLIASWIRRLRATHMTVLELAIILLGIYGVFFVAEAVGTSGVLAVVSLGFMMSAHISTKLSHEARHNQHIILAQIGYSCNQVTFLGAGIISARFMWTKTTSECDNNPSLDHTSSQGSAWLELAGLYFVIHLSRATVVGIFSPVLTRIGYGITWKESAILVYGGLRGAVGLIMALIVEHNGHIDRAVSQMIAFHTSGIVLLTLLINGSTVDVVYNALKLYPPNPYRRTYLRKVLCRLEDECQKVDLRHLTRDWFFHDCDYRKILRCVPNFAHIHFDAVGMPHADGILSMHQVLRALEEVAKFRNNLMVPDSHLSETIEEEQLENSLVSSEKKNSKRGSTGSVDYFAERWMWRKYGTDERLAKLAGAGSSPQDKKDELINLESMGDKALVYKGGERGLGLYVSCRNIGHLSGWKGDEKHGEDEGFMSVHDLEEAQLQESSRNTEIIDGPSFDIKVVRVEKARVTIGFIADAHQEVRSIKELVAESKGQKVLGHVENSVGFSCATGEISFNGPIGSGVVQPAKEEAHDGLVSHFSVDSFETGGTKRMSAATNNTTIFENQVGHVAASDWTPPDPSDLVRLTVRRRPGLDWEVVVSIVHADDRTVFVGCCSFGPFNPKELYPMVEVQGDLTGKPGATRSQMSFCSTGPSNQGTLSLGYNRSKVSHDNRTSQISTATEQKRDSTQSKEVVWADSLPAEAGMLPSPIRFSLQENSGLSPMTDAYSATEQSLLSEDSDLATPGQLGGPSSVELDAKKATVQQSATGPLFETDETPVEPRGASGEGGSNPIYDFQGKISKTEAEVEFVEPLVPSKASTSMFANRRDAGVSEMESEIEDVEPIGPLKPTASLFANRGSAETESEGIEADDSVGALNPMASMFVNQGSYGAYASEGDGALIASQPTSGSMFVNRGTMLANQESDGSSIAPQPTSGSMFVNRGTMHANQGSCGDYVSENDAGSVSAQPTSGSMFANHGTMFANQASNGDYVSESDGASIAPHPTSGSMVANHGTMFANQGSDGASIAPQPTSGSTDSADSLKVKASMVANRGSVEVEAKAGHAEDDHKWASEATSHATRTTLGVDNEDDAFERGDDRARSVVAPLSVVPTAQQTHDRANSVYTTGSAPVLEKGRGLKTSRSLISDGFVKMKTSKSVVSEAIEASTASFFNRGTDPNAYAKMSLSFEPQCTTDTESINELWNVLFNTVQHRYNIMHEHGILGETALAWLTEAVGEALDCACREVNALSAFDFKRLRQSQVGDVDKDKPRPSSSRHLSVHSTLAPLRSSFQVLSQKLGFNADGSMVRRSYNGNGDESQDTNVFKNFARMMETQSETNNFHGVFEPIIVEYLSLEQNIGKGSFWDMLAKRVHMGCLRQYGYDFSRTKIDALWAFVVAHEKAIRDSPTLERFPDLVRCINGIIGEARQDLAVLAELEPRRFFYCKQLLALRVLMNKRLKALHEFEEEGWLTRADAEGLEESLHERIIHADHYKPRIRSGRSSHGRRSYGSQKHELPEDANDVWKDVDLTGWVDHHSPEIAMGQTNSTMSNKLSHNLFGVISKHIKNPIKSRRQSVDQGASVSARHSLQSSDIIVPPSPRKLSIVHVPSKIGNIMPGSSRRNSFATGGSRRHSIQSAQ